VTVTIHGGEHVMAQVNAPAIETQSAGEPDRPRVLLADDHDLFRRGLRTLLEEQGVQVVAEATDGSEAVMRVREHAPDVVLMDINMPVMTGVEATREIARVAPLTRVVVLTISDVHGDVIDAVLAGACGYLLKDATIDELLRGIDAAVAGDSPMSPQVAATVLERVRAAGPGPTDRNVRAELSERELDVLRLLANGKDNADIARELHISPKTVKNHISNILMKLGIENRIQAAVYAVRSGIV
jgi:DNA-binding NarL/FixJ family response regulator